MNSLVLVVVSKKQNDKKTGKKISPHLLSHFNITLIFWTVVLSMKATNWSFLINLYSFTDNLFQNQGASAKKNVLTPALLSESVSPVDERSQCETSESSGKASFHNLASSQEEMTCRLTSSRTEITEQGKLGDKHEAARLECTESLTESSKTPLLRYLYNVFVSLFC